MRRSVLPLLAGALLMTGCGVNLPPYPLSEYTKKTLMGPAQPPDPLEYPAEIDAAMREVLDTNFSPPWEWGSEYLEGYAARLDSGAQLYRKHCIHCHGLAGAGDGPTAKFLYPRPRDYRRGQFKWKSTLRNSKPTRHDLVSLIKNGAVGSSMPPFVLLPEQDVQDLVDYVMYLSQRGELERRMLLFLATEAPPVDQMLEDPNLLTENVDLLKEIAAESLDQILQSWETADESVVQPEGYLPEYSTGSGEYLASLDRGKKLYLSEKASCYKCHSADGKAKDIVPSERAKMVDDWGNPNFPRNLTLGLYRGGRRPVDLYRRVHQGIAGAAMPAGGKNLKPEEIWDLVNFVRALPYNESLLAGAKAPPAPATPDSSETTGGE